MYYRLNSDYELRGWNKLPFGLKNRKESSVRFYPKPVFKALIKCDGTEDIQLTDLSPEARLAIEKFVKEGVLEESPIPNPIKPSQRFYKYPNRFITSAQWSITGKCNYLCRHCFMSAPGNKLPELSTEECKLIIDEMAKCGVLDVSLTGGEPLVRRDFMELVDYILEKGMTVSQIYTNGRLVDEDFLLQLKEREIHPVFSMSYDGIGWHDWMRGIPGAEEYVLNAMRLCKKHGFEVKVGSCLHQKNKDTLQDTVRLLSELGVTGMKVNRASPSGEWVKELDENKLSLEETYDIFLDYIPKYYEDGAPIDLILEGAFLGIRHSPEHSLLSLKYPSDSECENAPICRDARNTLYISPDGRAMPCMLIAASSIEKTFPFILKDGLRNIVNSSQYMHLSDLRLKDYLEHNPQCQECEWKKNCGAGCRAISLAEDQNKEDYLGVDEQTCFFYKNGYLKKFQEKADQASKVLKNL